MFTDVQIQKCPKLAIGYIDKVIGGLPDHAIVLRSSVRVLVAKGREAEMCIKMQVFNKKETPKKQYKEITKKKYKISSVGEVYGT